MDNYQQPQQPQYQQAPQQPVYQQPTYQQPVYIQQPADDMSVGDWMLTMLLCAIPIVNIICLIVWAVSSSDVKKSRKNWAIAQFIWVLIYAAIIGILVAALGSTISYML